MRIIAALTPQLELVQLTTAEAKNLGNHESRRQTIGTWSWRGRLLMQIVEERATEAHQDYLWVGTGDVNFQNLRFYYQLYYRAVHIRQHFFDQYSQSLYEDGLRLQDMDGKI